MRCAICDYCSEIDHNDNRGFYWDTVVNGYICGNCNEGIWEARNVIGVAGVREEDGEVAVLEESNLLELSDLEDYLREVENGKRRHPKQEEDIRSDDPDAFVESSGDALGS